MNNRFLYLFVFLMPALVLGQKKTLSHDDYDQWKSISSYAISTNGNFVRYEINPQQGDGELHVYDVKKEETHTFQRGYGAKFSYEEGFLVFKLKPSYADTREAKRKELKKDEMPKTHIVIVNLESWQTDTIKEASSFTMPEEHEGWIAIKINDASKKKVEKKEEKPEEEKSEPEEEKEEEEKKTKKETPKNRLVLMKLGVEYTDTLNWVDEYVFASKAPELLFTKSNEKADSIKGVYAYNDGRLEQLDTNGNVFKNVAIDESGKRMAWMSTQDSAKAEVKKYTLIYATMESQRNIVPEYKGMPSNHMASEFYKPRFSEDGLHLFFEVRKIPEEIEKDTMELKEEKVHLDIWSWTDTIIQPAQKINLKRTKEQGLKTVFHVEDHSTIHVLEKNAFEDVSYDLDNLNDWLAIGSSSRHYKSLSWQYPFPEDYYVVNMYTGERKLMVENMKGSGGVSPGGKYFYGYDKGKKEWFAIEIESQKRVKLNLFKDPVWNVENDVPAEPGSYGIAGWSKDDKDIFVNTQYNIWRVPINNPEDATQITSQEKDNPKRYRYRSLDYDEIYVSERMLLSVFEERTKKQGFLEIGQDGSDLKMVIETDDVYYTGFAKADEANGIILRKGNFVDYPELHYAKDIQSSPIKLSETNPQQKEYNWGTVELVSWKGKKGVGTLDGLLIKPENFDPSKKYPVLIYFYERYSDLKNYHFGFKPSASTINFAYFASNGYVVFIPDVVYEIGHPGKSAYNCIVSGAEWLGKQPYVDSEKMAIQGQSWGGYQVAYLVTQTDMFACAMAGAPVSNMTSAYGGIRWGSGWSREFQYEKTQSRLGGTLWDSRDLYIENSPVFFADKVNTPLLMMHNDDDGAVPWYQGIEYFMALRRLSKPTWMLVYNKEAHNLKKRHNRKDLSIRMAQFFDHYLKGEEAPEWMVKGRKAAEKESNKAY